ncbi:unnamed protein product, partial [Ectocarpus sp. 12 AP-2014]
CRRRREAGAEPGRRQRGGGGDRGFLHPRSLFPGMGWRPPVSRDYSSLRVPERGRREGASMLRPGLQQRSGLPGGRRAPRQPVLGGRDRRAGGALPAHTAPASSPTAAAATAPGDVNRSDEGAQDIAEGRGAAAAPPLAFGRAFLGGYHRRRRQRRHRRRVLTRVSGSCPRSRLCR